MKVLKLARDRDLIDPNFGGYKLSLDPVASSKVALGLSRVRRVQIFLMKLFSGSGRGPKHQQPDPGQYSFLHTKLFGEHNHLVGDPWGEAVYWVGEGGAVLRGGGGEVWQLPVGDGELGEEGVYNPGLVFIGAREAALSDGRGMLYVVDTGARGEEGGERWQSVFQGDVCGRARPFVVVGGGEGGEGGEREVVLQYVEQRERVEGRLPAKEGKSEFLNCLEWVSLGSGEGGLRMERVRRVATQGGINCVGIVRGEGGEARLVLSVEKKAAIVFDSMNPAIAEEEEEAEVPAAAGAEVPVFYWSQLGGEDLEVWLYVGELVRSQVKVILEGRSLVAQVRGVEVLRGELCGEAEQDTWSWSLEGGKLSILLCKGSPGPWPSLWGGVGGSRGEQVTEGSEDNHLAHLTTDSPLVGALPSQEPGQGFNSEELEACDSCETEDRVLWLGGGEEGVASLEGRQHLLTLPSLGSSLPQLCSRHDVDGLVWRLQGGGAEHVATFPALGYVQVSSQGFSCLLKIS